MKPIIRLHMLFVFALLTIGTQKTQAQCDFTQMGLTIQHAICENNGSIVVSVPGTCTTRILLKKDGETKVYKDNYLTSDGTNSTTAFTTLGAGKYNLFYMDGAIEKPYEKNPVVIKNTYVPISVSSKSEGATCTQMDIPDGRLIITVKEGTGLGPFVYTLTTPRGTQTSEPTMERTYTFDENSPRGGVLSGERVSFSVTDTKNGLCSYTDTQTPIIATPSALRLSTGFDIVESETCNKFIPILTFGVAGGYHPLTQQKIYNFIQQPGNLTITVTPADGSGEYTLDMIFDEARSASLNHFNLRYYTVPEGTLLNLNDKFVVKYRDFCSGEIKTTSIQTVTLRNIFVDNQSTFTKKDDCSVDEKIRIRYWQNSLPFYFNDPAGVLKLYRKDASGNWVETQPKSGELTYNHPFPNGRRQNILDLNEYGTYKLEYTDACRTIPSNEIRVVQPVVAPAFGQFVPNDASMHGNTGGLFFQTARFNYTDSLTITVDTRSGETSKTLTVTEPFSTKEFETTIRFPYTFKMKTTNIVHIADLPEGAYTVTVTDKCNSTISRDFEITKLLTYNPKNTDGFVNGLRVDVSCNNSNSFSIDFGTKGMQYNGSRLYKLDPVKNVYNLYRTTNSVNTNGQYSLANLPLGEYELRFFSFIRSGASAGHSLIKGALSSTENPYRQIIPISIQPYATPGINSYTAMCDPNTDTGMIDAHLVGGTPSYPLLYELYAKGATEPIKTYLDTDRHSTSHLFTDLPKGEYTVKITNGYNSTLKTGCGSTEGDVTVDGYKIPAIQGSSEDIYVGENATLSINLSPNIYDITWYQVKNGVETEIGTGVSVQVSPQDIGDYEYKVKLAFSAKTPCKQTILEGKNTALSVLEKNYWMGGKGNTLDEKENWGDPANWTANRIPKETEKVEFATLDNYGAAAVNHLRLDQNRTTQGLINSSRQNLIIPAGKSLTVKEDVSGTRATDATAIWVKSSSAEENNEPSGSLILSKGSSVKATVEFYNQAYQCQTCGTHRNAWQYFTVPVKKGTLTGESLTVNLYDETQRVQKWQPVTELQAFKGYEVTKKSEFRPQELHRFAGDLLTQNVTLQLTKTNGVTYEGMNLVGNSFTAAIPIASGILVSGNIHRTAYLFNTGTYDQWRKNKGYKKESSGLKSGTYLAVPFQLAGKGIGDESLPAVIPSMHTFMLQVTGEGNPDVTLRYDGVTANTLVNGKAWRATAAKTSTTAASGVAIDVAGTRSTDRVWLFEHAGTTTGFDNGWDGYKTMERDVAQLYVSAPDSSKFQVATVPQLENSELALIADEEGYYRLRLSASADVENRNLYLRDLYTQQFYPVSNNAEYMIPGIKGFTGNRFRIVSAQTVEEKTASVEILAHNKVVTIVNRSNQNCLAYIYDTTGRLVAQHPVKAKETQQINLSQQGVYVVKVMGETVNEAKRIII